MENNEQVISFAGDPLLDNFNGLVKRVNNLVGQVHGQASMFNIEAPQGNQYFTFEGKSKKLNGKKIRLNATVPNAELFSLAQELVKPADEPFSARDIFDVDSSFNAGSQEIGFDVVAREGKALLVATGTAPNTIPRSDVSISRELQSVGKIMGIVQVTRDDIQLLQLRRDRGIGPLVDLLSEKLDTVRENISRAEDQIIWEGGEIDVTNGFEIKGLKNFFGSGAATVGETPSLGLSEAVAGVWNVATSDAIITDIAAGASYISRNSVYKSNTMVLPANTLIDSLGLKKTSETDSTPLINWIKAAFQDFQSTRMIV